MVLFEQLEVNYVLLSNLTEENNTSEATISYGDGSDDKSKAIDEQTRKSLRKIMERLGEIY